MRCLFLGILGIQLLPGCEQEMDARNLDRSDAGHAEVLAADDAGHPDVPAQPGDAATFFLPDPGEPAGGLHGPKCWVRINGQLAQPGCLSGVFKGEGQIHHLFLNFCVRNLVEECEGKRDIYVSLLLALPAFKEAQLMQAIGGRVSVSLANGQRFEREASPGQPLPINFRIFRTAHAQIPEGVLHSEFELVVPRVDAAGDALSIKARIN